MDYHVEDLLLLDELSAGCSSITQDVSSDSWAFLFLPV